MSIVEMTSGPDLTWWRRILRSGRIAWLRTFRAPRRIVRQDSVVPKSPAFYALGVLCLLVILIGYAGLDARVARWTHTDILPGSFTHTLFSLVTILGRSAWWLIITFVALMVLAETRWEKHDRSTMVKLANRHADATFICATVAVSGVLVSLLKYGLGRARPKFLYEYGSNHFAFPVWDAGFASFPSGHATTFGALGMGVGLLFPKWRWPLFFAAIFGASSRVLVGAHWISDIVAGLAFGAGFVLLSARFLAQRGTMFRFDSSVFPRRVRRR